VIEAVKNPIEAAENLIEPAGNLIEAAGRREQENAEREKRLAAYRGGAAAAFASIIELAQRKKSRARSKRAAKET
jgi:hypothetical protein